MNICKGDIVTVVHGGQRADYVVTKVDASLWRVGGYGVDPEELELLRLTEQPSGEAAGGSGEANSRVIEGFERNYEELAALLSRAESARASRPAAEEDHS